MWGVHVRSRTCTYTACSAVLEAGQAHGFHVLCTSTVLGPSGLEDVPSIIAGCPRGRTGPRTTSRILTPSYPGGVLHGLWRSQDFLPGVVTPGRMAPEPAILPG